MKLPKTIPQGLDSMNKKNLLYRDFLCFKILADLAIFRRMKESKPRADHFERFLIGI